MRYSSILSLAALAGATPLARRADSRFKPGTVWDIVLQSSDEKGSVVPLADLKSATGTVIDIDLEDNDDPSRNTKGWIKELAKTKTVICYFSAGTYEPWRSDASAFTPSDYGKKMDEWDEYWLDLKKTNVKNIMEARIKRAAAAGCHAIDPDNIDGYSGDGNGKAHQDGFNYDKQVYIDYVKWLSATAKKHNMVTGLKNALEISESVLDVVEFAVNEQCHEAENGATWDCPDYRPFTAAQKAVFNIEYHTDKSTYCKDPTSPTVNLSTVLKPMGLDTLGGQC